MNNNVHSSTDWFNLIAWMVRTDYTSTRQVTNRDMGKIALKQITTKYDKLNCPNSLAVDYDTLPERLYVFERKT